MPVQVILAAVGVSLSLVVVVWSVATQRVSAEKFVSKNLTVGLTDLRQLQLERSALDRAVVPTARTWLRRVYKLTPAGWVESLERRLVRAGLAASWPVERLLVVKLTLGAAGFGAGFIVVSGRGIGGSLAAGVLLGLAGYFFPDLMVWSKIQERQTAIISALPDTLDQVTISVEAGLGFESALERAARNGVGPLAEELLRALQEIKLGLPRAEAFKALAERTDVSELRRFVYAINQAEAYGMPVASVLRVQAADQRLKRQQRAEERAMKIPVKILFPLIFCIFPTMFIVIIGPAVIQLVRLFLGDLQ